jgi:sensor c-di-GMP phosphodiesterase-like protein
LDARQSLETDLRKALANNEFELFVQPQVDLKLRFCCSFEALLAWTMTCGRCEGAGGEAE